MQNTKDGLLIVISGPSGVGKGTVCKGVIDNNPTVEMSISATTREKRAHEIEGVTYFYKTRDEFLRMADNNEFLEYTEVFGCNYYGTPRAFVQSERAKGRDVILEIDVQGAMNIKKAVQDAVLIFIAPPSMAELKSRLVQRGREDEEAISRRFYTAYNEIKFSGRYDYVVVNDVLKDAVRGVEDILGAERLRVCRNRELISELEGGINI